MRVAFLVLCRDKERHVAQSVRSVLAQTFSPMEILISDQGSVDGSRAAIRRAVEGYGGPNKIRLLDAPADLPFSMAGLNAHVAYAVGQTDADIILATSADDLTDPERTAKVVKAYRDTGASAVGTAMWFSKPDAEAPAERTAHPAESGMLDAATVLLQRVGGSSSLSFARDLYEKYSPIDGLMCQDVAVPFWATLERGYYWLRDELQIYVRHAEAGNMGLEGRILAATDEAEQMRLGEVANYQVTASLCHMGDRAHRLGTLNPDAASALGMAIMQQTNAWVQARDDLAARGITPMASP